MPSEEEKGDEVPNEVPEGRSSDINIKLNKKQ